MGEKCDRVIEKIDKVNLGFPFHCILYFLLMISRIRKKDKVNLGFPFHCILYFLLMIKVDILLLGA